MGRKQAKTLPPPNIFYFSATTTDGKQWDEREMLPGATMSPWQQLRQYCAENKVGIQAITARMPGKRVSYSHISRGFVVAYSMSVSLSDPSVQSLSRGIGFVVDDSEEAQLHITWFSEDGASTERVPATRMAPHIIWSPPVQLPE